MILSLIHCWVSYFGIVILKVKQNLQKYILFVTVFRASHLHKSINKTHSQKHILFLTALLCCQLQLAHDLVGCIYPEI